MALKKSFAIQFDLVGDEFPHAWFFNRFRVDKLGNSFLVTLGLVSEGAGILASNAFVISDTDHKNNKERVLNYLKATGSTGDASAADMNFSAPPARVYPINHVNLSRVDSHGEIGLYRFSINSVIDRMREINASPTAKFAPVKCYPTVMFRSDLSAQLALLSELYSFEDNEKK